MNEGTEADYAPPEEWQSIALIYELALRELDAQAKDWEEADGRLRLLLGFIGVIFAASLGVTGNLNPGSWEVRLPAFLGVLALAIAAVLAGLAYVPRQFHRPPNVLALRGQFLTRPTAETQLAIVDQLLQVYTLNRTAIAEKLKTYQRAQLSFLISVIFIAGAIAARLIRDW